MGYGTALTFARAGYEVRVYGRSDAGIDKGFRSINNALAMLHNDQMIREADNPGHP